MSKIFDFLANRKNIVFLSTCLYVHVTSFMYYLYYGATYLAIVNAISSVLYIILLITAKSGSERNIVIAFSEIMIYSVICEFLTVGSCGFIYYPLGMVAVIFHLVSTTRAKKTLLQVMSIIGTFIIYLIDITNYVPIKNIAIDLGYHKPFIVFSNLLVTVITMVYVSYLYITEQEQNRAILEYNTNHDQLTGLYNRRYFYSAIETIKRSTKEFSLAMVDLDNFKKINDTYGHEFGDAVLKDLSEILMSSMGENDIAVRWGGEEFILFMPGTDLDSAEKRLEKMQDRIRNHQVTLGGKSVSFTATIGLASGNNLLKYEQVINTADQMLYYGKSNGKNRIIKEIP
ncbi:MAG: GGDEF domain-containing protein [Butyrivibrio sp.]|nr:GGDEF domain-containing protein [Butyrivibrio sp.]